MKEGQYLLTFIIKKLVYLVTVLIGISLLSFILANIAPISPAEAYVRRITKAPTDEMMERYNEEFGFNQSIPEQYINWLGKAIRLDFGSSYATKKPVIQSLLSVMPTTLALSGLSAVFILALAVPLGLLAAHKEGSWADKCILGMSFISISVPGYFLGLLILLSLGIRLNIIPIIGDGNPISLCFASFVLAFPMIGSLCRILRALLLEQKNSPYVLYAKARGISRRGVTINHLLRNAAPPCIVMFGQNIGYLIAGTMIVENIFSMPGMGQYALNAALSRDFPIVNCYMVLMAFCFVLFNTLAEAVGKLLNPKLTREETL